MIVRSAVAEMVAIRKHLEIEHSEDPGIHLLIGPHRSTASRVVQTVARAFQMPVEELRVRHQAPRYTRPRYVAALLMHEQGMSLPEIGRALGGFHHTSVLAGIRTVRTIAEARPEVQATIDRIREAAKAQ